MGRNESKLASLDIRKLTPWFDAKIHSPSRIGWYECQECSSWHYFKDGIWYRNKKSIDRWSMTIHKMHWRGLMRESLESCLSKVDPNVPLSPEELEWVNAAPVGMEFGSPDFEQLNRISLKVLK